MKNNHGNGLVFRPLESLFQQWRGDAWMAAMNMPEQFHLVCAQPRGASLATEQLGELVGELRQRPDVRRLRAVIVDAVLGFFLELLLVPSLEQLEILVVQRRILIASPLCRLCASRRIGARHWPGDPARRNHKAAR
jgi:hypothetical protein